MSAGVSDYYPIEDLYHEYRNARRLDHSLRKYNALLAAEGNIAKGGGAFTPRYVVLLDGTKIVPFNDTVQINQLGDIITDDPDTDPSLYDISGLTVAKPIFIKPSEAETIQLNSEAIVFASFQGAVWVDTTSSYSDKGTAITPNGNTERPVNNIPVAIEIAVERGFRTIQVIGNLTLGLGDDVRDMHLIGTTHINSILVVDTDCLCLETRFSQFDITGVLDGDSEITDCVVRDLEYFNGHIHESYLTGTIKLRGNINANMSNCSVLDILNPPTIDAGGTGQNLMMPNFSGLMKVTNLTGPSQLGIGLDAGQLEVDATCTAGTIIVSGSGAVVDNSPDTCYVINSAVDGTDINNIQYLIEGMREHHSGYGQVIFWDPYGGNDAYDGAHPARATKTFAGAHAIANDNGHDIIIALSGDPSGTTTTTENVAITKNYTFLRGPGRDFTIHSSVDAEPSIDLIGNGCEVSGLIATTNTTNTAAAIRSTGSFPLIASVFVEGSANGILISNGGFGIIQNTRIGHNTGVGITIEGASEHFKIQGSHVGSCQGGGVLVDITTGHECTIERTVVHGNTGYGIDITANTNGAQILSSCDVFLNTLGDVRDLGTGTHDESSHLVELHEASYNRRVHDSGANTITIYESDDVTPKKVFDTNADLSDITPQ